MSDKTGKFTRPNNERVHGRSYATGLPSRGGGGLSRHGGGYWPPAPDYTRPPPPPKLQKRYAHPRPDLVASFGKKTARTATPLLKTFVKAYGAGLVGVGVFIIDQAEPQLTRVPTAALIVHRYPQSGYWEKRYGDFVNTVYYPSYNDGFGRVGGQTWHEPISGQALSGYTEMGFRALVPWDTAGSSYGLWYRRSESGVVRYAHHSSYFRKASPLDPAVDSHAYSHAYPDASPFDGRVNPNIARRFPSEPAPQEQRSPDFPKTVPPITVWTDIAVRADSPALLPQVPPQSLTPPAISPPKTGTPATGPQPSGPLPPPRDYTRSPSQGREREAPKARSRVAAVGIAAFKAFDAISEVGDFVDIVYKALPIETRIRWEKERFGDKQFFYTDKHGKRKIFTPHRGFADQSPRLGVDGADWKAQAIYHNAHLIDPVSAFSGVIKNHIEDKIVGRLAGARNDVLSGKSVRTAIATRARKGKANAREKGK